MLIHRVIFRLDYKLNYRIVESPGAVMEILNEHSSLSWDSLQDAQKDRAIAVKFVADLQESGVMARTFVVNPTTLVFNVETAKGFDREKIKADATVSALVDRVQEIAEKFKLFEVRRAGLRVWAYSDKRSSKTPANLCDLFTPLVNAQVLRAVESSVGRIEDVGFAFDGASDKHAKYHVRFGPISKDEVDQKGYFELIAKQFAEVSEANFILDVDLYENDFSIAGRNWWTWIKYQLDSFNNLSKQLDNAIGKEGYDGGNSDSIA